MHYAITPDGQNVRSYGRKTPALEMAAQIGGHYANDDEDGLKDVPTPLLVTLHNLIRPERPIARFSDRATGEKRLKGVLEVLSKPGEAPTGEDAGATTTAEGTDAPDTTQDNTAPGAEETEMASKTAGKRAGKRAAKKSTAKKTATVRANANPISDAVVKRVIKMRADGKGWPEILKELDEPNNFISRVRPLMKAMDKSSVRKLGPGSPNYGKATKKGKR
jgi:hypothetical protein